VDKHAQQVKPKGFGEVLKAYVDGVDGQQRSGAAAVQDLVTGKTKDVLPAVTEVAKADLSFKLLLGVRNKVIEAYKETMRMQV
jgi:flagellar hook-basal body complex protein FliE